MILDEALALHRLDWCVLPMKPGTKRPAIRSWKCFQAKRPTEEMLRSWFNGKSERGLAVVLGSVSGGLVCRDFDQMEAFEAWAEAFPEAAQTLPQSVTARGRHVFCRVAQGDSVSLLSPSGASIINYGDGELRGAGLSVLPPSVHESGHVYRWLISPVHPVPVVDLEAVGLARPWCVDSSSDLPSLPLLPGRVTEEDVRVRKKTEPTEENSSRKAGFLGTSPEAGSNVNPADRKPIDFEPLLDEITKAIAQTLPTGEGQRQNAVFRFAKDLKGIPALADARPSELRSIVLQWHREASPVIRTQSPEETLADFYRAWPKVKHPSGVLRRLLDEALSEPLPACCEHYSTAEVKQLVALCRRLAEHWQPKPFPLACRSAGELFGVPHNRANRWLFLLTVDGVLELVETGSQKTRRASRYFYRGD